MGLLWAGPQVQIVARFNPNTQPQYALAGIHNCYVAVFAAMGQARVEATECWFAIGGWGVLAASLGRLRMRKSCRLSAGHRGT